MMYYYGMFVRVRERKLKDGSSKYAYLVDNQWNSIRHKHEQKIIACLGNASSLPSSGTIEKIIVALDTFAAKAGFNSLSDGIVLKNLSGEKILEKCFDYGLPLLASHALKQLSLEQIAMGLAKDDSDKNLSWEKLQASLIALLSYRLKDRNDASERSTLNWYQDEAFLPHKIELKKDDLYRTLDFLIAHKEEIEKQYFEANLDLFSQELDLVLFDTTSIYYWGAEDNAKEEDLLQYGFSKDGKGDLKQLIVGVLMTSDGVPIAHEVFPGNQPDVFSFSDIIQTVKKKYHLKQVVLIADRGMVSEENLQALENARLSYVLGIRMRTLPQVLTQKLLGWITREDVKEGLRNPDEDMQKVTDNLFVKEFPVKDFSEEELKEFTKEKLKRIEKGLQATSTFNKEEILSQMKKRRFFVCLNPFLMEEDHRKREFFQKVIKNKISFSKTKDWIIKNGYKKYLKFEEGIHPSLDEERLKAEEIYDGKWVLLTNHQTLTSYQTGKYYKTLQTIERGFKDLKSLITIQPVFHFKEQRIKAHVFVCFLSLILKWYISRILNTDPFSPASQMEGREFLKQMQNLKAIEVDQTIPLLVRTSLSPEIQEQMKKLRMKIPGKIIVDGRQKPQAITHNPGRPRKTNPNQLPLVETASDMVATK